MFCLPNAKQIPSWKNFAKKKHLWAKIATLGTSSASVPYWIFLRGWRETSNDDSVPYGFLQTSMAACKSQCPPPQIKGCSLRERASCRQTKSGVVPADQTKKADSRAGLRKRGVFVNAEWKNKEKHSELRKSYRIEIGTRQILLGLLQNQKNDFRKPIIAAIDFQNTPFPRTGSRIGLF